MIFIHTREDCPVAGYYIIHPNQKEGLVKDGFIYELHDGTMFTANDRYEVRIAEKMEGR